MTLSRKKKNQLRKYLEYHLLRFSKSEKKIVCVTFHRTARASVSEHISSWKSDASEISNENVINLFSLVSRWCVFSSHFCSAFVLCHLFFCFFSLISARNKLTVSFYWKDFKNRARVENFDPCFRLWIFPRLFTN